MSAENTGRVMKERLSNVLAWFAFLHGLVCVVGMATLTDGFLIAPLRVYFELAGLGYFELAILAYSPLIWILLYVLDGKPRFLPWVK